MKPTRYIFGAPLRRESQKEYEEALLARFGGNVEKAIEYVTDFTSSQISRASGILSSISILAGMSYFVKAPAALAVALISIVLVAISLYMPWPSTPSAVGEAEREYRLMCRRCYTRSICNKLAISLIILIVVLLVPHIFVW